MASSPAVTPQGVGHSHVPLVSEGQKGVIATALTVTQVFEIFFKCLVCGQVGQPLCSQGYRME